MNIVLVSFGYRYGKPKADIIISARKLPNPWCINNLRKLNGTNWKVHDYVVNTKVGREFVDKAFNCIIELAKKRQDILVAIGCIGGKHRSVAIVCELYDMLVIHGIVSSKKHRDMKRK